MYSFYGGRPGNSFIIVTTFPTVEDMAQAFKEGPNYTTVHYDEYVMINTVDKNDPNNGKLYRRGYNFADDTLGGAEYIGTIVGPSGKAPHLELTTIEDINSKIIDTSNSIKSTRIQQGTYSFENGNLVPGKTLDENGDVKFNNEIQWKSCSFRTNDSEDTTAYIGFTFPYPVIEFEAQHISSYSNDGTINSYPSGELIGRIDNQENQFYEKWRINIPKGIKGDTFKNLKVITASSNDGVGSLDNEGKYQGTYQGKDNDNNRQILVYEYYNYDNREDGLSKKGAQPRKIYLGDYNMINNINVDDDGTLTIEYTHNDSYIENNLFKWINSVTLTEDGTFTVIYNYGSEANPTTTYSTSLDWINGIKIDNDGTVKLHHSNGGDNFTNAPNTPQIKWCTGVNVDDNGTLTFNWNHGDPTSFEEKIQWIDTIELNSEGIFSITYNTYEENTEINKTQIFDNKIKWINGISLANDGTLTVTYNTSTNNIQDTQVFEKAIKSISSVTHNIDNQHNGHLQINYNTGNSQDPPINLDLLTGIHLNENTGLIQAEWNENGIYDNNNKTNKTSNIGTINFIKEMAITEDGDLVVFYADPNKRGNITVNGTNNWNYLGKVAPYGSNTNMTVSKIIRGKHFIDVSDNKNYLEFYIENIGLLRAGDEAKLKSGTAILYYNGVVQGDPITLNNIIISSDENVIPSSQLSTLNFKIELNDTDYPVNSQQQNPIDLVDIQLINVEIEVAGRNRADAATSSISDQLNQINSNTRNIRTLNEAIETTNENFSTFSSNLQNNISSQIGNFNTLKLKNQQQPMVIMMGNTVCTSGSISDNNGSIVKICDLPAQYAARDSNDNELFRIIPVVSRKFKNNNANTVPSGAGDFYYAYYSSTKTSSNATPSGAIYLKLKESFNSSTWIDYTYIIYATPIN